MFFEKWQIITSTMPKPKKTQIFCKPSLWQAIQWSDVSLVNSPSMKGSMMQYLSSGKWFLTNLENPAATWGYSDMPMTFTIDFLFAFLLSVVISDRFFQTIFCSCANKTERLNGVVGLGLPMTSGDETFQTARPAEKGLWIPWKKRAKRPKKKL